MWKKRPTDRLTDLQRGYLRDNETASIGTNTPPPPPKKKEVKDSSFKNAYSDLKMIKY